MKRLIVLLALLVPLAAAAITMRTEDGRGNYVRLFDMPCSNSVILKRAPREFHESLRAGEAQIDGKVYAMCWLFLPNEQVGWQFEDGDSGRMPMQVFKPEVTT